MNLSDTSVKAVGQMLLGLGNPGSPLGHRLVCSTGDSSDCGFERQRLLAAATAT